MKKLDKHIIFSAVWMLVLSVFFTNATMASVKKDGGNPTLSYSIKKLMIFTADENSSTSTNDVPENSSSENRENSFNDVEDSVNNFDIVITTICTIKNTFYNKSARINHRQSGKLHYNADIVPPPPKF